MAFGASGPVQGALQIAAAVRSNTAGSQLWGAGRARIVGYLVPHQYSVVLGLAAVYPETPEYSFAGTTPHYVILHSS